MRSSCAGAAFFLVAQVHQLAVAVPLGNTVTQLGDQGGADDGQHIANGGSRDHLRNDLCLVQTGGIGVDAGQGHHAGTHAAAHHGHGNVEDRLPEALPGDNAHQTGHQRGAGHGNEADGQKADGSLFQQFPVHAEDAAGDEGGNVEIEETDLIHKGGAVPGDRLRQQAEGGQCRRCKDAEHRTAAEIRTDDGCFGTDEVEQAPQHHHHGQRTHHVGGENLGHGGKQHQSNHQQIDGQAHACDLDVQQRPEPCGRFLFRKGHGIGSHGIALLYVTAWKRRSCGHSRPPQRPRPWQHAHRTHRG